MTVSVPVYEGWRAYTRVCWGREQNGEEGLVIPGDEKACTPRVAGPTCVAAESGTAEECGGRW